MTAIPQDADAWNRLEAERLTIEQAMREAVDQAVQMHKRLGLPMVEWHDDRIVWVPAEKLEQDDEPPISTANR